MLYIKHDDREEFIPLNDVYVLCDDCGCLVAVNDLYDLVSDHYFDGETIEDISRCEVCYLIKKHKDYIKELEKFRDSRVKDQSFLFEL